MKYLVLLLLVLSPAEAARMECVRWVWTGDIYNRKVVCLEWRDRDAPKKEEKKKTT